MRDNKTENTATEVLTKSKFSFVKFLKRFWVLIFTIALVITVLGSVYGYMKIKPTYRAETNTIFFVILTGEGDYEDGYNDNVAKSFTPNVASAIKSNVTANRATDIYLAENTDSKEKISAGAISVSYNEEDLIFKISYTDKSEALAIKKLDCVIKAAKEVIAEDKTIVAKEKGLTATQNRFDVIESSSLTSFVIICIFLGVILGVLVAFLISVLDNKVKDVEDIESITGVSLLTYLRK